MRSISEDDKSTAKTLYIIGNGFDLAHEIKSKYKHFKEYYLANHKERSILDFIVINGEWNKIEIDLGNYKEDYILDEIDPNDGKLDLDHYTRDNLITEDSVHGFYKPIIEEFCKLFRQWVDQIDINVKPIDDQYNFNNEDLFLTFNYTETLEEIYNIPCSQVLHIHGKRYESEQYVFGIKDKRSYESIDTQSCHPGQINAKEHIVDIMNDFVKPYDRCLNWLNHFLENEKINEVVVYGHSLGKVDWPYFEKIIKIIGDDIPWEVNCYEPKDKVRMQQFKQNFGLKNIKAI